MLFKNIYLAFTTRIVINLDIIQKNNPSLIKEVMKLHYFLFSMVLSAHLYASEKTKHISNCCTSITFNKEKKSIILWLREDSNNAFGKTPIFYYEQNKKINFQNKTLVKNLSKQDFGLIVTGNSFYCRCLTQKNNIYYGAIVINKTNDNLLNSQTMLDIYTIIKNQINAQKKVRVIALDS